jgi:hypothetical protein
MRRFFFTLALLLCPFIADAQQPLLAPSPLPTSATALQPAATGPVARAGMKALVTPGSLPPEKANPVRVGRFEKPPTIDGRLDEEMWKHAAVLKDFYQTQPGDNIAPSRSTELLIGYDDKFLYLGFRAHEQPDQIRATVAKRDAVLDDDNVRVYLDTFNDQRKAYVLVFNPLGVQQDGILTEGNSEDYSVDIVMESKGVLTPDGYEVEAAIPFKSLRYEAGKGKLWGIQVLRRIKHINNEQDSWVPIFRENSSFLGQEGHITGLEGISTERQLELIPSLTVSETGKRISAPLTIAAPPFVSDPGRFLNQPAKVDLGLTAKLGITPTVTLALAVNPDFAQVEADQTVVTANQRFPIFFEEKRPFFLEGIETFQTMLTPVHTRAIVDPDVAIKLTGKRGRNTFGLMLASDNAPGNFSEEERTDPNILPSIQKFLDKNAYIGVLRLKRDIGHENYLGFIATSYNFIEKHNQLGGFDGRFRINPKTTFQFQVLGTTSRRFFSNPDFLIDPSKGHTIYRTGNGFAYSYILSHKGRNFGYDASGVGRTRDYEADVGFTPRTNTNGHNLFVYYMSDPKPKAKLVSWRVHNFTETAFNWQRNSQFFQNSTALTLNSQRESYVRVGFQRGYERVFEEEFGPRRRPGQDCRTFDSSKPETKCTFFGPDPERSAYRSTYYILGGATLTKRYSFNFEVDQIRGALDFDFGAGPRFPRVSPAALANPDAPLDPGPGRELFATAGVTYQPTNAFRMSLNYTKDRLRREDTGRIAFDTNIFAWRATYQFTRFTFARARVDYDTLAARVRSQFLLGWTPNPGTSFYVGYNNDLSRNGFSPFTGEFEPGFRRNGQTFFIKMSYLFRRSF